MASPIALGALSLSPRVNAPLPRVRQDEPAYGVGGKGFFDDKDKFWQPGQALYFSGVPNKDLTPLNKMAYDRMQSFLDMLDELGAKKAKKEGRAYVPEAREEWREDGNYDVTEGPEYVMGMKKDGSNQAIR